MLHLGGLAFGAEPSGLTMLLVGCLLLVGGIVMLLVDHFLFLPFRILPERLDLKVIMLF